MIASHISPKLYMRCCICLLLLLFCSFLKPFVSLGTFTWSLSIPTRCCWVHHHYHYYHPICNFHHRTNRNVFLLPKVPRYIHSFHSQTKIVVQLTSFYDETTKQDDTPKDKKSNLNDSFFFHKSNRILQLKQNLLQLANRTNRGFQATNKDRIEARQIIFELNQYNPTEEPVRAYYDSSINKERFSTNSSLNNWTTEQFTSQQQQQQQQQPSSSSLSSLKGKWTLVYTDAPDITSLDFNPMARLGRIGQDCQPPYITNVIEYRKPLWATSLPFSGTDDSRILQKVVTKGSASPKQPTKVYLSISALKIETDPPTVPQEPLWATSSNTVKTLTERLTNYGIVGSLLQDNPIVWNGPLDAPFGEFEVLYLDDEFRIIRTGQNYFAVNVRQSKIGTEWF